MNLNLTTPALLFPAISLLLLAYTNRFLALASVIRGLHAKFTESGEAYLIPQIISLRKRVLIIQTMQFLGVNSLLFCVVSMYLIFIESHLAATYVFGIALILLISSLLFSVWEIQISAQALNIQISALEHEWRKKKK